MTGKTGCFSFKPDTHLDDVYKNMKDNNGMYFHNKMYSHCDYEFLLQVCGDEILTTDQEILARIQEIEKRMEKMEAALENINNILKKVEKNTYFGCYMPEGKLE